MALATNLQCLLGGIDWADVSRLLMEDISWPTACLFSSYICIGMFLMMNIIVGLFVERVTMSVREDKDESSVKDLMCLFVGQGKEQEDITWETFAQMLDQPLLLDFFAAIDVYPSVSDAREIFDLIDTDQGGSISSEELASGCARLKGPARALDLALLGRDLQKACQSLKYMDRAITAIDANISRISSNAQVRISSNAQVSN
jgi:hypothetical protein